MEGNPPVYERSYDDLFFIQKVCTFCGKVNEAKNEGDFVAKYNEEHRARIQLEQDLIVLKKGEQLHCIATKNLIVLRRKKNISELESEKEKISFFARKTNAPGLNFRDRLMALSILNTVLVIFFCFVKKPQHKIQMKSANCRKDCNQMQKNSSLCKRKMKN